MDTNKTIVIFRKFKGSNDIIALFPAEPYNDYSNSCESYMHVGQHSAADYSHCLDITKPASPVEYRALHKELRGIGYNLSIRQKYYPKRSK